MADDRGADRLPDLLRPRPGEQGLLSADLAELGRRTVRAWQLFAAVVDSADLSAATRSRGNRARELIIPVGEWPDSRRLSDMVADAHAGLATCESHAAADRRLRAAHRDASDDDVRVAVHRAREHIQRWYDSGRAAEQGSLVTPSPLGPVPIATLVHAAAFQLAVTARDLFPAGARPDPELEGLGVVALVDSAGAVAARLGASASIAALTPEVVAGTGSGPGQWRTVVVPQGTKHLGPGVKGPAGTVVDIAAGRADFFDVARHVRLKHPRRLVEMSVVLDGIPDLPAAGRMRRAAAFARSLPF